MKLDVKKYLYLVLGCVLVSAGLVLLRHSHVMTGGTAGLSLTISYILNAPFSWVFFLINLPFYGFAIVRMGWNFTLHTVLSVTLVTLLSGLDKFLPVFELPVFVGTVAGSILCGLGLSVLFMNRTSLGGVSIFALYMQQKRNWNPGVINGVLDTTIVLLGLYSVGLLEGILSVLSVVIVSAIISYFKKNFKPSTAPKHQQQAVPYRGGREAEA